MSKLKHKVMCHPDWQIPFQHRDALDFTKAVIKKERPTLHINLGDEIDHCALSEYDKDPDGQSAGDEFLKALEMIKDYYSLIPNMTVCISNHGARPFRKAKKYGIPSVFMKDYKDFMQAPKGWNWVEKIEVDGVLYLHGEGVSGRQASLKLAQTYMQPVVHGHLHSHAGIYYSANSKHLIWGFNVGCLIDRHAYAFAYGKHHVEKPILGVGIVDRGIPKYIPMLLDSKGRWTGKL